MQPLSRNPHPDLLTSLMNISLVLPLPPEMHLSRSSSNGPRLPSSLDMLQTLHTLLTFDKTHNPLHLPHKKIKKTSERPKVVRTCNACNILTEKRASPHNGVHFFDVSTSKSGPTLVCFAHFDLETRFTPQHRTLFQHLNFQTWSENGVFFKTIDLEICFAPQFDISACKTARTLETSPHNSLELFISHLATWLRTRRFRKPSFHNVSRLSYLSFAPASSFL